MFDVSVGLDAAGKTTILYKLKLGEIVTTIPTIGETSSAAAPERRASSWGGDWEQLFARVWRAAISEHLARCRACFYSLLPGCSCLPAGGLWLPPFSTCI